MQHSKVIIIGAGAAGIAAASRLLANNISNIVILEAQNRIGGRIHTTQLGDVTVNMGAQWVHGEVGNVCFELGSSQGLLTSNVFDLRKSEGCLSNGTLLDEDTCQRLFGVSMEIMHDSESLSKSRSSLGEHFNKSIREVLKRENVNINSSVLDSYIEWYEKFQNSIDGADSWFQTSAKGTLEYHECEGNTLTTWKSVGYNQIFPLLMGKHEGALRRALKLDSPVSSIEWGSRPVVVTCGNGASFSADHVLVTVSVGVLKQHAASLFTPALPHRKMLAIKDIGTGTVNKIFLKFPFRWWPETCPGFNLLWDDSDKNNYKLEDSMCWVKEVFGFYSVDNSPVVLCGWVVGEPARQMELCSEQQVIDGCHKLLVKFLGGRFKIPIPDGVLRSKWYSNPYVRASYSFRTVASDESNVSAADLAAPLCLPSGMPVVLFGGEATHDHLYSTVHGAVETGWREADRIIALQSTRSCQLPKSSL